MWGCVCKLHTCFLHTSPWTLNTFNTHQHLHHVFYTDHSRVIKAAASPLHGNMWQPLKFAIDAAECEVRRKRKGEKKVEVEVEEEKGFKEDEVEERRWRIKRRTEWWKEKGSRKEQKMMFWKTLLGLSRVERHQKWYLLCLMPLLKAQGHPLWVWQSTSPSSSPLGW